MPRAHGSDRLELLPDGRLGLLCREAKGWKGRQRAERAHRVDHPGTALLWEGAHWEVLEVEARPDGWRYVLGAWDDANVFRALESYDEESEERRVEEKRLEARAGRHRGALIVLAPLAGLLPGDDQLRLENRLGVRAARMTLASAIPLLMLGAASVILLIAWMLTPEHVGPPVGFLLAGSYFLVESFARLSIALSQGRPVGSAVTLPWLVLRALGGPKPPDLSRPPDARELAREQEHLYRALQPLLALLPEHEQVLLKGRYGFDPVSWGRTTARILYGVGVLFAGSSVVNVLAGAGAVRDLLWLAAGGLLIVEQRRRLARLREGLAAGSALAFVVRRPSRRLFLSIPGGA